MRNSDQSLTFPPRPGFYSVVQTNSTLRTVVVISLLGLLGALAWLLGSFYAQNPQGFGLLEGITLVLLFGVFLAFLFALLMVRPFMVRDNTIHLMRPVKTKSGRRKVSIPLSEVSDVSLVEDPRGKVQIWLVLNDGTRFLAVTMVEEEHKEFARRLAAEIMPHNS